MPKTFFKDMIKMKSDLRKEMSTKEETPPQAPMQSKPEREAEPNNEEVRDWAPTVSNKVTRNVELASTVTPKRSKYSIWLAALVSVVFLFFAVSYFLAQASITITPKIKDTSFNQNFLASKEANGENLVFDSIVISDEEVKNVEAGEAKDTLVPARGLVVIYNNYSGATQRLDINTRLEGSNGKMYKTEKAVVVPGKKGNTPGSVEVGIYAAEAGDAGNSSALDFQVFGFKGTPKYSKFYARSKGDIIGGLKGKVPVIADAKKEIIVNDIKATLGAKLEKKASGLIPPGFVLFKDATILNVDNANFDFGGAKDNLVPVSIKGTLTGILFNEKDLTEKITSTLVVDKGESEVYISNMSAFQFTFLNKDGAGSDVKNVSFNLSGSPKVVWKVDEDKLKTDVAGKSKKEFYNTLAQYPNVVSADVVLRPFWKRSFPSNKEDIKVLVEYPK